ncbi:hypothetical protein N9Z02_00115 [Akkermansiaceae bacterium]|nr:hypothetical protein [Akkermansiaceae bacterium]
MNDLCYALQMMTKRFSLIASAWIASCGAAYYLGSASSSPLSNQTKPDMGLPKQNRVSSRSLTGNSSSSETGRVATRLNPKNWSAEADLAAEIVELAKLNDPIARAQGMLSLVDKISPEQFTEIVAAFRALGMTRERMSEYAILLTAWAKVDPVSALDYATKNTGTSFARQTILASWVQTQPEAAIAWAQNNFDETKNSQEANPWIVGIIKGIASQDISRASQLLQDLPYSQGRGEALDAVLGELTNQGSEKAKNWISDLTDERLQAGAAARLATNLAGEEPEQALEWASSISEESLLRASPEIIGNWAVDAPDLAKNWIGSQTEEIQAVAARGLMSAIASKDPADASAWLSQHEGNPAFDDAIQSFVYGTIQKESELSASWIIKMTDARKKEGLFHRVLGGWMREDSPGAMNFIQNNDVPDSIARRAQRQFEESNQ